MGRIARSLATIVVVSLGVLGAGSAVASASRSAGGSAAGDGAASEVLATLKVEHPKVEVKKRDAEKFKPAKDGQKLREGDTVRTDAEGRAEIDYSDDAYTRLDVSTTFTITKLTEEQGARQVEGSLDTGRTWNRTEAVTESGSFEQSGAGATAAVAGTAFAVTCTNQPVAKCSFLGVYHELVLTSENGEVRDIPEYGECSSTEADLCDEVHQLTPDEIAAIAWVQENLLRDLLEHSYGPGPVTVTINATLNVEDGQVTSVAIVPQTTPTTTTTTSSNQSSSTPPPPAPPVIDADPVDVLALGGSDPDVTGGTTGPNTQVVTEDEVNGSVYLVTFVLRGSNPDGSAFYYLFTDLPDPRVGTLYATNPAMGLADVAVDLVTHYLPDTVFSVDPVQIEPVCDYPASSFSDCYTNGDPSEGPDAGAGTVPYPATVEDTTDGTVKWTDSFTFKAVDESSGVESAPVTVNVVVYDDICGEDADRDACDVLDSGSFDAATSDQPTDEAPVADEQPAPDEPVDEPAS